MEDNHNLYKLICRRTSLYFLKFPICFSKSLVVSIDVTIEIWQVIWPPQVAGKNSASKRVYQYNICLQWLLVNNPCLTNTLWVGILDPKKTPPQKAFRRSKHLLTRFLRDFGRLGIRKHDGIAWWEYNNSYSTVASHGDYYWDWRSYYFSLKRAV